MLNLNASTAYKKDLKLRNGDKKRVFFSVNLPVCAMVCRTDFACWEVSQTLLKVLSLPTTPHKAFLTEF